MAHENHGLLGSIIKKLMVIIFTLIGITIIVANAIVLAQHKYPDHKTYEIINLVFGCLLLTSPFFLKKADRGLFSKTIKVIMIIVFVAIGALYIATGSYSLAKADGSKTLNIIHIVFGSLLFTSPYFLKKD